MRDSDPSAGERRHRGSGPVARGSCELVARDRRGQHGGISAWLERSANQPVCDLLRIQSPRRVRQPDLERSRAWEAHGFIETLRTPDSTLIFVTPDKAREILADQVACMGCLSQCRFSNWEQQEPEFSTGKRPDPRSFCIQKTLQDIAHESDDAAALERNLMFSGHNAYRFAKDPYYSNGFIPTVKQLVERILTGR